MKALLINIWLTSRFSAGSYAFAVKGLVHYYLRSRSGQVHSLMAALRSLETNLTLTCSSPKSFVCNLPDSGRHVTSIFQGLSLSRSVGWVGENPGNEVGAIWLYHSIRIPPSDPREYAQNTLGLKPFITLTFITILSCGIDLLSVSDPGLEIRGGPGHPDPEIATKWLKLFRVTLELSKAVCYHPPFLISIYYSFKILIFPDSDWLKAHV